MSGPFITDHGDVVSSALEVRPNEDARHQFFSEMKILRGQIQQIYAVDSTDNDPGNEQGTYTVYDVLVWKPDGSTEVVKRCRALQPLFGGTYNNFLEVLPTDPGPDAKNQDLGSSSRPGTHVVVGFIGGQKLYGPVILGALPHPNEVAVARRPTEDKGVYLEGEFQGFNWIIDNDGAFTMTFNGPRDEEGNFVGENGPTIFNMDMNGNINISTNNKQTITVDQENQVVDVVNGDIELKMDQNGEEGPTITVTSPYLVCDVKNDAKLTIGGKTTIDSTSDLIISSGSAINFQKGADSSASEPFVLGQQFKTFMNNLLSTLEGIQCIGNLGAPAPLNPSVIAQLQQLGTQLDSLLSTLISGTQ